MGIPKTVSPDFISISTVSRGAMSKFLKLEVRSRLIVGYLAFALAYTFPEILFSCS